MAEYRMLLREPQGIGLPTKQTLVGSATSYQEFRRWLPMHTPEFGECTLEIERADDNDQLQGPKWVYFATIPPNQDGDNDGRAEWAEAAIATYRSITGSERDTAIADFLCNLRHACDRQGLDWDRELRVGMQHYKAETE